MPTTCGRCPGEPANPPLRQGVGLPHLSAIAPHAPSIVMRHAPGRWRGGRVARPALRRIGGSTGEIGARRQKGRRGAGRCAAADAASNAAAIAKSRRDLTSMTASTRPRRARMSISPDGQRQPRATIRQPRSRRCQRHSNSARRPRRSRPLTGVGGPGRLRRPHRMPSGAPAHGRTDLGAPCRFRRRAARPHRAGWSLSRSARSRLSISAGRGCSRHRAGRRRSRPRRAAGPVSR